jgi:hypothetical protein
VLIGGGWSAFIHAHPLDSAATAMNMSGPHVHCAMMANGAAPSEVRTSANFSKPGQYKLWAQLHRRGEAIAVPFVLQVK